MQAGAIHKGNLLALATDPQKMEALKQPVGQLVGQAIRQSGADMDKHAVVVGLVANEGGVSLVADIVLVEADDAGLRPLLSTLHLVAAAIFDAVKDQPVDDDEVFDAAVARTRQLLTARGVDQAMAAMLTESAIAAIHAETFAGTLVTTVHPDGRLLVLKAPLLARLLLEFQNSGAAPPA